MTFWSRILRHRARRLHRRDRKGAPAKLQIARGGTLCLDEIGRLPLPLQSKCSAVLQEKEFEPVGSNEMIHSDVRVIAATSTDWKPRSSVASFAPTCIRASTCCRSRFRPRERLDDIPALSEAIRRTAQPA